MYRRCRRAELARQITTELGAFGFRFARPAPNRPAVEFAPGPRATIPTPTWTWAALMRRVFALDVLACPRCGGRLRVIASVQDPAVVHAILAHLGLAPGSPGPAPPASHHTAASE